MSSTFVETTLNYHLGPTENGELIIYLGTVGERRRKHDPQKVKVEDIRGREEQFTLDMHGFQVVISPSTVKQFDDPLVIKQEYYADCAELLKRVYVVRHY